MNFYVVGLKPEQVPILREVRGQYVSAEHPPASTLVGVTSLALWTVLGVVLAELVGRVTAARTAAPALTDARR